jgi:hypothetical protein
LKYYPVVKRNPQLLEHKISNKNLKVKKGFSKGYLNLFSIEKDSDAQRSNNNGI